MDAPADGFPPPLRGRVRERGKPRALKEETTLGPSPTIFPNLPLDKYGKSELYPARPARQGTFRDRHEAWARMRWTRLASGRWPARRKLLARVRRRRTLL